MPNLWIRSGSSLMQELINRPAIEKQKEAQKQLGVVMRSIQAVEEEVKKLKEENDLKLTQMVSVNNKRKLNKRQFCLEG